MAKIKKRLTQNEEFEIMKLVLDKFLWLGFAIMGFGLYQIFNRGFSIGMIWIGSGIFLLVLFMIVILKEYERIQ